MLVTVDGADDPPNAQQRIDKLWPAWVRDRGDVEALRELHFALGERLREFEPAP